MDVTRLTCRPGRRPGNAGRRALPAALGGALLAVAQLATAGASPEAREPTCIPAEALGLAIRTLAKERGFQVVYDSRQVGDRSTRGAEGELTVDEALTEILRGTGLTFEPISDRGVAIEPLATPSVPPPERASPVAAGHSAPVPSSGIVAAARSTPLGRVMIEASKDRRALRHRVDHFVSSVIVQPWNDALDRWNKPICPLVAGLPKAVGEVMLERISKAALEARAPLAGKVCDPDLYVVATDHPERLLKKWWARDRRMYFYRNVGIEAVERFIHSRRPIRVWYNPYLSCGGRATAVWRRSEASMGGFGSLGIGPAVCTAFGGNIGTHLSYGSSWSNISQAIVVIDLRRIKHVNVRQISDYVALVGLVDVRADADPGSEPSILQLFGRTAPPRSLTQWDRALLYSLYNTSQSSRLQVSEIEATMVRRIGPLAIASLPAITKAQ